MLVWWSLPACPSACARGGWVPCSACTHTCTEAGVREPNVPALFRETSEQLEGLRLHLAPLPHAWLEASSFPLPSPPGSQCAAELSAWVCTDALPALLRDTLSTGRLLLFLASEASYHKSASCSFPPVLSPFLFLRCL